MLGCTWAVVAVAAEPEVDGRRFGFGATTLGVGAAPFDPALERRRFGFGLVAFGGGAAAAFDLEIWRRNGAENGPVARRKVFERGHK